MKNISISHTTLVVLVQMAMMMMIMSVVGLRNIKIGFAILFDDIIIVCVNCLWWWCMLHLKRAMSLSYIKWSTGFQEPSFSSTTSQWSVQINLLVGNLTQNTYQSYSQQKMAKYIVSECTFCCTVILEFLKKYSTKKRILLQIF